MKPPSKNTLSSLLSPLSFLLSLLLWTHTQGQTYYYFQDSPLDNYYDFSWLVLTTPSYLELAGYDSRRFPVETTTPAQQGMNSLRLHWRSVPGGYWHAIAAGLDWAAKDISQTDTLAFYFYAPEGLAKEKLPTVFLEDINNTTTTQFSLTSYADDLPPDRWTRITVPMKLFFDAGDPVDFTKIKTVGWGQNLTDDSEHTLFIDDVRVQVGDGSSPPVATPTGLAVSGYDSHVYLKWNPNTETNLNGYEIYRSTDNGTYWQKAGIASKATPYFSDFVRSLGTNLNLQYKINALNAVNQPSVFTESVTTSTHDMTDEELMNMVQEATFRYFWDFAHPVSGLTRERNTSGDVVTIGGSGFGVMAVLVGIERGFITRQQGVERMLTIVHFLESADRFHGAWPHWMNGNTGDVIPFTTYDNGGDLVETAFMFQGLLTARHYFDQNSTDEQTIRETITQLWESMEWDWYRRNGSSVLYWHWSPNYGWQMNMTVRGYNEAMIVYILAIASPTHGVPANLWETGWAGSSYYKNGKTFYGYKLDVGWDYGGPLFFAHYSFLGFDPRNIKDKYTNYFNNNKNMSLINQAYCMDNPKNYSGYSASCWGLTASDDPSGYSVHEPITSRDNGTITPSAALSSMPYTPQESMAALKHFYRDRGADLWGPFGFYDAFNVQQNWYADSYLAIDQGPIICMIENHRSGLLWDKFMKNPEIAPALESIGFVNDPYSINGPGYDPDMISFSCSPNPAHEETILTVECKKEEKIDITIVSLTGQKVRSLHAGRVCPPGIHRIRTGLEGIPSGLYFIYLSKDQHIIAIDKLIKQ
ncbi:MAG: T9SS type A sorting domain-containing protein [Lentimicrobiaceae bacterium]|nr:T9SS type A sorting domain-containing protein [Lentimicrobiaceae bacterium]